MRDFVRICVCSFGLLLPACGSDSESDPAETDGADSGATSGDSAATNNPSSGSSPSSGGDSGTNPSGGGEAGEASSADTSEPDTGSDDSNAEGESGGGPSGDLEGLSDEFDDPSSLAAWTLRHQAEGEEQGHEVLDINQSESDHLTFVPRAGGWFGNFRHSFLYKLVRGDFMIEVWVAAGRTSDPAAAPTEPYNSAGILVRDPSSRSGNENWVMHNVGWQNDRLGTEGKTTVSSMSNLTISAGARSGRLRVCRVGGEVVLTRRLDDEGEFRETHRFTRGDFADELQVGLVINGWNSLGGSPDLGRTPDLRAVFDYARFSEVSSVDDCLAD